MLTNRRVEELKLSELKVDFDPKNGGYQRRINPQLVSRGIKNFHLSIIDTPLVACRRTKMRSGECMEYYIVDGQHTVAILRGVGIEFFPCNVMDSEGRQDEAPAFIKSNEPQTGGVNVKSYDRYIAGLSCNHPTYVKIKTLLDAVGVTVCSKNLAYDKTNAVGTLHDLIDSVLLEDTLHFIKNTWPKDDLAWSSYIIKGVITFLGGVPKEHVVVKSKKIKKFSCHEIRLKAQSLAKIYDKHIQNCIPLVLKELSE